jgi:hypothetical protein
MNSHVYSETLQVCNHFASDFSRGERKQRFAGGLEKRCPTIPTEGLRRVAFCRIKNL